MTEARRKAQKAKFATFASQFFKAFEIFCKENDVKPDMKNVDLLRAFYMQKNTAKVVNAEAKRNKKREKANIKHHLGTVIRPGAVKYNK
ncbi:MAG: hypothetical protein ACRCVX_11245, partial [Shewanella sp.]